VARRWANHIHVFYRRVWPAIPAKARLRPHPRLYALAALLGLSLTHHRTALLVAPALLVFGWLVERRVFTRAALLGPEHPERPGWLRFFGRPIVLLLLCLLMPLLLYLYLPIRGGVGSLDGTYVNSWSGFWRWVTGRSYGAFLGENPLARSVDGTFYVHLFWSQLGPLGLALAAVGVAGLVRRPRILLLTGLAFLAFLLFGILYRAPDLEVFFIPAFLIAAIWAAAGLDHALDLLRIRGPSLAMRRVLAGCSLVLVLASIVQPVSIAARAYPEVDLNRRWEVHDWGELLLRPRLAEGTVVGLLGEMTLLRYLQETEGIGVGLETLVADKPAARLAAVEAGLARGQTVYVTRSLQGLAGRHSLSCVVGAMDVGGKTEALIRVGDPVYDVPSIPNRTDLEPLPGLELLGYGVEEHSAHARGWTTLRLWWRAGQGMSESLKISARLLESQGMVAAVTDSEPVAWTYPTTAWRPGEVVADAYEIPWPAGAPPGVYTPLVIVYDPATGQERGRAELPPVSLAGSPALGPRPDLGTGLARTAAARFAGVELVGFTPPDPAIRYRAGDALPLTLLWLARQAPQEDLRLAVLLAGGQEIVLSEDALGGAYPSSRWTGGQAVRQIMDLRLPGGTPPGSYRLKLRVTRAGHPVPWGRWLLPLGSDLDLGSVQVGPE
jgi:hypothetical protein